ncbi:MAG TPA: hypothetical protein VF230_16755 [Acidimicrobiales bacterium]
MPEPRLDHITEGAARWLARRTTRRSFLGRVGRGAVFVAGGSSLATVLVATDAEARVCGQSGVSPKCPTYDCDDVWGWCWYATGCCAGGELKKICDCCRANHPNVHGYCPSGTNVLCIVESCGADPRVQVVSLRRVGSDDPVTVSAGASRMRFPAGEARSVWLTDAADQVLAAAAAPAAAKAGAPLLLTSGDALAIQTIAEIQRLGASSAVLVGPARPGIEAGLRRYGLTTERYLGGAGAVVVSEHVTAQFLAAGARRVVCVEPHGLSASAAPLGAALAAAKGYPVVVGVDRAKALASGAVAGSPRPVLTYLVGPEASARAGEVAGGHPFRGADWASLSREIFDVAFRVEGVDGGRFALIAVGVLPVSAALAAGGPILVHPPGGLDGVRDSLFLSRDRFRAGALCGATNGLTTEAYYEAQSIVNGFDAHKLIGVAGQGLPVIEQPEPERPIGLARRSVAPPVRADAVDERYWTGRAGDLTSGD